jgi:hypothetical protein
MTKTNSAERNTANPKQTAPKAIGLPVRTAVKAGLNFAKIEFQYR